jgi:isoaspartyl peptidase/L-asparaginase-like protein (Ntn-hydrolase superfamily)
MLTSTKAIVCYADGSNSGYGTACILTESSGTITAGTPAVFESASTSYISVAMLTSTKAIVCYSDNGNSGYGTACILAESSGTITAGTPEVFESAGTVYISAAMLTSTKAIVCYSDVGNSWHGTANTLVIS